MKGHLKIGKRLVGLGLDVNEANRVRMLFIVSRLSHKHDSQLYKHKSVLILF